MKYLPADEDGTDSGWNLSVTDQHYALIITPLFDTQAPTCFGFHVPSSGSFLCPYELPEGRIGYAVCHVLWMLDACVHWLLWFCVLCCPAVACVHWLLWFRVLCCPAGQLYSIKQRTVPTLTFRNRRSYIYRTGTPLPSKHPILYIFSKNLHTICFKHATHFPFFSIQNAVYFIMLPFLVRVLFAF
jgi:hypothetical protein